MQSFGDVGLFGKYWSIPVRYGNFNRNHFFIRTVFTSGNAHFQTHPFLVFWKISTNFSTEKNLDFPSPNLGFQEDTKMGLESISH